VRIVRSATTLSRYVLPGTMASVHGVLAFASHASTSSS